VQAVIVALKNKKKKKRKRKRKLKDKDCRVPGQRSVKHTVHGSNLYMSSEGHKPTNIWLNPTQLPEKYQERVNHSLEVSASID